LDVASHVEHWQHSARSTLASTSRQNRSAAPAGSLGLIRPNRAITPSPQLLEQDSANISTSEDTTAVVAKLPKQPRWTELEVDPRDSRYFHFFLDHLHMTILYSELFPTAIKEIFSRTVYSTPLRHAVLCISSLFVDQFLGRSSTRMLVHKQAAFASLQECIASGQIDEDLAIAIFLVLLMDVFRGKAVAHAHLRGLYLVLKQLHIDESQEAPKFFKNISPIVLLLWRIAVRLDSVVSTTQDVMPVFPPLPLEHNRFHASWAMILAKDRRSADWAVASFAIDSCYLRANHWAHQAGSLAKSEEYFYNPLYRVEWEAKYKRQIAELRHELWDFIQQPAIVYAQQREMMTQQEEPPPNTGTFLNYPPLNIYDRSFALLINKWRGVYLLISFILTPLALRRRTKCDLRRAIEYCRTFAALDIPKQSKYYTEGFFGLLTAAYTFLGGRDFKQEFEWCRQKLAEINASGHPILQQMQPFADEACTSRFDWRYKEWQGFDSVEEGDEISDVL
jgi:hypothetical protein